MIHEFDCKLEVDTPLGRGTAIFIESADNDYYWTVVLNDTRSLITFRQNEILVTRNFSMGWGMEMDDMKKVLNEISQKTSRD
jgi:hypothetical protein